MYQKLKREYPERERNKKESRMSLRIIYGRAGTGKSEFCLNEIKKNQNQKIYIITPEQFSYSMERRLLQN